MALLTAALSSLLALVPASPDRIVIDGRFDDWNDIAPALVDPADAPAAEADLGEIRIASDDRHVHFSIELRRELNVQRLDGRIVIPLDVDGRAETGVTAHGLPGTDLVVIFSPHDPERPDRPGMGVGLVSPTHRPDPDAGVPPLSPYDVGLLLAPTWAADRIELRLDRSVRLPKTPPLFVSERFAGRLVLYGADSEMLDSTETFRHKLQTRRPAQDDEAPEAGTDPDPLARPAGTDLRIMTWNTRRGALLDQREAALRILDAVQPDVILLQELTDEQTAGEVAAVLDRIGTGSADPPPSWSVIFGPGGGDLRCAIATRKPTRLNEHLWTIAFPDQPDRTLRMAAAVMEADGGDLLAVSVHLKCCGRIGDESDRTRELEAQLLNEAIRKAVTDDGIDGIVVAGDLNLVGGRRPLDLLAANLDRDDSPLDVVEAMQPDGRTNVTWRDADLPFIPGRLDFALISGTALEPLGGFVLDAGDLAPSRLTRHGLTGRETDLVSDHLPLIVDVRWRLPVD